MRSSLKTVQLFILALAAGSCLMLALSVSPNGTAAGPHVQEMRGVWDGFNVGTASPPEPVRTELTGQENRRFTGFANPPAPEPVMMIDGTVSASGNVNYQGESSAGRTMGKAKLLEFGNGAAVLDGSEMRQLNGETFIVPCVLVMRAFAGDGSVVPNPQGRYVGMLGNGMIDMTLANPSDPDRPTSFEGTIDVAIDGETHAFQLRGTINSGGRIIAIAATTEGHMIFDAVLSTPPDPSQPTTLNGGFTLELHDGTELEGSFATQQIRIVS